MVVIFNECAKLRVLRTLAPYQSLIRALPVINARLCAFTLIKKHLTRFCLVLLQMPLCMSASMQKSLIQLETTMGTSKNANFQFQTGNTLFGQIWPKKTKLLVQPEIQYPDQFEYPEFNGDVHFFCFLPEIPFLGKFCPKIQNYHFELNFGTQANSDMHKSMVLFRINFFQKTKIFSLS